MHGSWKFIAIPAALLAVYLITARISHGREDAAMLKADPEEILLQPALRTIALKLGGPVYHASCATCHGADGTGDPVLGVPDLTGERHLYGEGRVAEIEDIARHGIRSADKRGPNLASMPAYGTPQPYKKGPIPSLTPGQIEEVTQYVLALGGRKTDPGAAKQGGVLYHGFAGCYDCHGNNGEGDTAIGAPSLIVGPWVFGHGSHGDIYKSLEAGRGGVSPAFGRVLNAAELRSVAVYIASLQKANNQQADAR